MLPSEQGNLTEIVVTPPSPSVVNGQTQQFIATGIYSNGVSADLTSQAAWTSSDPSVADIDVAGLATSLSEGAVTIRALFGGKSGATDLSVAEFALVSITVFPATLNLQVGQTQQFGAIGTYTDNSQADITTEVTWDTSDPSVATINDAGFAQAVNGGTVAVTIESGLLAGSAALTIQPATQPPSGLPPPPQPGTPADYLLQAQQAMFQLLLGNKPSRVDTPQLGAVEFAATTPAQLQRAIDYLQGLVMAGNIWPSDGSAGSLNAGYTRGRKPFSFYGWP